ncbi:fungal-specific transcription factor domain-containing protein [Xylariaceae sp. FL1651]|nr:fungal-specific transcription factor domain-containing protein [Xylariaceae sp. FL1651]
MHHQAQESGPIKKKNSRSRSGCLTCRARKIKCDESPNGCINCERINVACPGYGSGQMKRSERSQLQSKNSSALTEAGIKRSRILRSCNGCRQAKTKCSGDVPACLRCQNRNLPCVYEVPKPAKSDEGHNKQIISDQQSLFDGVNPAYHPGNNTPADSSHWSETAFSEDASLLWLMSSVLPDQARIRQLIDAYFVNVHPLRCLGFIHIPSFKQRLDLMDPNSSNLDHNALLYVVCALGARFYALDHYEAETDLDYVISAGRGWASRAHSILLGGDLSVVSVDSLMATVLLHDYQLRVGNYVYAFIMTGIATRMAQLLRINTEPSPGSPEYGLIPTVDTRIRESKRRLAWSCFTMDVGLNGIEQLDTPNESDIKLQLPCNERNFIQEIPCITEVLQQGRIDDHVPEHTRPAWAAENMGLVAYFVRLAWLRKKVLNFVKTVDLKKSTKILAADFCKIDGLLQQWHSSLPAILHLNSNTIYIRKETNQLSALFTIHLMYYSTMCDLYSIGDQRLSYSPSWQELPPDRPSVEQVDFLTLCRKRCFDNAKEAAMILTEAVKHGTKVFSDTWMLMGAFGIIRVLWCQITFPSDQGADAKRGTLEEVVALLQGSMEALRLMKPLFCMAGHFFQAATHLLKEAGLGPPLVQAMSIKNELFSKAEENSIFTTTESALNPLDVYNLAQPRFSENRPCEFALPALRTSHSTADLQSLPEASTQYGGYSIRPAEASEADDFDILSSQLSPVADQDLTSFSFDTMALIQDDWLFEGVADHSREI